MSNSEGLKFARFMMVLSSLSPLFILWAVRGISVIPDFWCITGCVALIVLPNAILYIRVRQAHKQKDYNLVTIGEAEDHRDHLLVYLFTMLLPLYALNLSTWRDFSAVMAAFIFIVFIFFHLNIHYMNLIFALFGFRVYTITPNNIEDSISGRNRFVLITSRCNLCQNQKIKALRLSNTVYLELREDN